MNQNDDITSLFKKHFWEKLANSYSPIEIANSLSFKDSLRIAYRLLYNDGWEETLQEYAVKLLYEIRKMCPENWNESWEYDALLGLACYITLKYDERYEAYKQAFDKTNNPLRLLKKIWQEGELTRQNKFQVKKFHNLKRK